MSDFENKLADRIINSDGYKESSAILFNSYVQNFSLLHSDIERKEIKKLLSSAQIFYRSDKSECRKEGAAILSMLLDVCAKSYPDIIPIAANIFTNSGDFPNIQLLSKRYPNVNFKMNLLVYMRGSSIRV